MPRDTLFEKKNHGPDQPFRGHEFKICLRNKHQVPLEALSHTKFIKISLFLLIYIMRGSACSHPGDDALRPGEPNALECLPLRASYFFYCGFIS